MKFYITGELFSRLKFFSISLSLKLNANNKASNSASVTCKGLRQASSVVLVVVYVRWLSSFALATTKTKMCPQPMYLPLVALADRVAQASEALREERDLRGFEVCFRRAPRPLFLFQNAFLHISRLALRRAMYDM